MEINNLQEHMNRLIDSSSVNRASIKNNYFERIFEYPLIKVAKASDPLFKELKNPAVIGKHHLLPKEWLTEATSVISYFLPFSQKIREANSIPMWPATEWLYGRIEGEKFNNLMRQHIIDLFTKSGGKAIAPMLSAEFKVINLRSNWSERHIAFIAGLGTFSLNKSIITVKGCAGRYGSIVVNVEMVSSKRSYTEIDEYCIKCGKCIERCPAGAITLEGKNVEVCSLFLENVIIPRYKPRYGCGKCQTAVPCENTIPYIQ